MTLKDIDEALKHIECARREGHMRFSDYFIAKSALEELHKLMEGDE